MQPFLLRMNPIFCADGLFVGRWCRPSLAYFPIRPKRIALCLATRLLALVVAAIDDVVCKFESAAGSGEKNVRLKRGITTTPRLLCGSRTFALCVDFVPRNQKTNKAVRKRTTKEHTVGPFPTLSPVYYWTAVVVRLRKHENTPPFPQNEENRNALLNQQTSGFTDR